MLGEDNYQITNVAPNQ